MNYLDFDRLEGLEPRHFRSAKPYPWLNPQGVLTQQGFEALCATLPEVSRFTPSFDVKRKHGQASHDRYTLEYDEGVDLSAAWRAFLAELGGKRYRRFLRRMFGHRQLELGFHWHYAPAGCSVSPHCDSRRKLGSHLFYFNTPEDWDPAWGGQTVILDDGGRFPRESNPSFEDFQGSQTVEMMGNRSALFTTTGHSWHGVRELTCPEGSLRKVFIVVVNKGGVWRRIKRRLKGKAKAGY